MKPETRVDWLRTEPVGRSGLRHRGSGRRLDTWIGLGVFVLTAVLVILTCGLLVHDRQREHEPAVQTRVVDAALPSKELRVVVRAQSGKAGKDYQLKPVGEAARATDTWGECCFSDECRGSSADLFDPSGTYIATVTLPLTGHLEIKLVKPAASDS